MTPRGTRRGRCWTSARCPAAPRRRLRRGGPGRTKDAGCPRAVSPRGTARGCRNRHTFRVSRIPGRRGANRFHASASTGWYDRRCEGSMACREGNAEPAREPRLRRLGPCPANRSPSPGSAAASLLTDMAGDQPNAPDLVAAHLCGPPCRRNGRSRRRPPAAAPRLFDRAESFGTAEISLRIDSATTFATVGSTPLTAQGKREHRLPPKPLCNLAAKRHLEALPDCQRHQRGPAGLRRHGREIG